MSTGRCGALKTSRSVTVQACPRCRAIALALEAEAGSCCVVGNLNAKLESREAQHKVAFELANEKSIENVQLGSDLTAARSKVSELELRVEALEEQATLPQEELELGKKKIADPSVNVAVLGV